MIGVNEYDEYCLVLLITLFLFQNFSNYTEIDIQFNSNKYIPRPQFKNISKLNRTYKPE